MKVTKRLRLAALQMNSTKFLEDNLERAVKWISRAAESGADVVALPENFAFMGSDEDRARMAPGQEEKILGILKGIAREQNIILLCGSISVTSTETTDSRPFNTSVLLDRAGNTAGVYHKIHLFDVSLADGVSYRESEYIQPGDKIVTTCIESVTFGMSICYDLRFPALYRALARQGAEVVFLPAAFTLDTGKDHWLPLLQARAIENQFYIIAPAQFGRHDGDRRTFGHSAIVDPWGVVLAQSAEKEGLIYGEFDGEYLDSIRERIPVLQHERPELY